MPLHTKVKDELDKMESLNVIYKVESPTPWYMGIVAEPKKTGTIRICLDLKPLNESVERKVHPLLSVRDTLAQLAGAKIFSTLDTNSGFWQVPLAPSSKLLTTFLIPDRWYCFNKLLFGTCSARRIFPVPNGQTLSRVKGVLCHMDDIIAYMADIIVFGTNKD